VFNKLMSKSTSRKTTISRTENFKSTRMIFAIIVKSPMAIAMGTTATSISLNVKAATILASLAKVVNNNVTAKKIKCMVSVKETTWATISTL